MLRYDSALRVHVRPGVEMVWKSRLLGKFDHVEIQCGGEIDYSAGSDALLCRARLVEPVVAGLEQEQRSGMSPQLIGIESVCGSVSSDYESWKR